MLKIFLKCCKKHKYRGRTEGWNGERTKTQVQIVVYVGVRIYVDSYWSKSIRRNAVVILSDHMRLGLSQYIGLIELT
jgi:hypothetical protein